MANAGNYAEELVLTTLLKTSTTYLSAHTAVGASESSAAWISTELTGAATNYARVTVATTAWTSPAGVSFCETNTQLAFPSAGSAWGTITHVALWDVATINTGNLLVWFALPSSRVVGIGDVLTISSAGLTVTAS